jgi:hypothetical protein
VGWLLAASLEYGLDIVCLLFLFVVMGLVEKEENQWDLVTIDLI